MSNRIFQEVKAGSDLLNKQRKEIEWFLRTLAGITDIVLEAFPGRWNSEICQSDMTQQITSDLTMTTTVAFSFPTRAEMNQISLFINNLPVLRFFRTHEGWSSEWTLSRIDFANVHLLHSNLDIIVELIEGFCSKSEKVDAKGYFRDIVDGYRKFGQLGS